MAGSLRHQAPVIPEDLRADWPLSWHAGVGLWCKRRKGKLYYFGREPRAARTKYAYEWPYISVGKPVPANDGITVAEVCEKYVNYQQARARRGEIQARFLQECEVTCAFLVDWLGQLAVESLKPQDFEDLREGITGTPKVVGNKIGRVRRVFKYAYTQDLISQPVKFGAAFEPPSKREKRQHQATQQDPVFSAAEIRALLEQASPLLKAAILLGINGGMYAIDVAQLEHRHIQGDMIVFPRGKTGIDRKFALWPETIEALQAVKPRHEKYALCRTVQRPLYVQWPGGQRTDSIGMMFQGLKRKMGYAVANRGFKSLRKTFRTVADEVKDGPAVLLAMGHADSSISAEYRELSRTSDERVRAVAEYVRKWLFP